MTTDEIVFAEFTKQTRKHLKTLSKNQLVAACLALLIENYNMKTALAPEAQKSDVASE